jgi:hypothetical protein
MSLCAASTLRHSKQLAEALNYATIENISKLDYESYQKNRIGGGGQQELYHKRTKKPNNGFCVIWVCVNSSLSSSSRNQTKLKAHSDRNAYGTEKIKKISGFRFFGFFFGFSVYFTPTAKARSSTRTSTTLTTPTSVVGNLCFDERFSQLQHRKSKIRFCPLFQFARSPASAGGVGRCSWQPWLPRTIPAGRCKQGLKSRPTRVAQKQILGRLR